MKELKVKKLSTRIAMIVSIMLLLIFGVFICITVLLSKGALTSAIESDFNSVSEKTAIRVQGVFDEASGLGMDLQAYMTDMYKEYAEQEALGNVDTDLVLSDVCGQDILPINKTVEDYLTHSIRAAVENNEEIMGAGAFFAPYAYDPDVRDYALYITEDNPEEFVTYTYEEYSNGEYFKVPFQTKQPYSTPPYEDMGVVMVSSAYPILLDGEVQGVIVVDINVSTFNNYAISTTEYPTAFNEILTDESILVFDSTDLSGGYVGMSTADFIKDSKSLAKIDEGYSKGEAFTIQTAGESGQKLNRFYYPIDVGGQTWWSLFAVDAKDMNKSTNSLTLVMILMSVGALAVIVVISVIVLRKKINPINSIVDAAYSIAAGDFNLNIESQSNDEIGQLANTFSHMSDNLKAIISDISYLLGEMSVGNFVVSSQEADKYVGQFGEILTAINGINQNLSQALSDINVASDQVSAGSDQVSSGAQSLAQGATEQASSIEELSASISDVYGHVNLNAQNAAQAKLKSAQAGSEILESNQKMQEMIEAMNDISSKSSEIGKIIKTIDDIAFQTNILALNAAVEAARAGASGKGFAVVADEVRNLAGKSAEAAKTTASLIEDTIQAVSRGSDIAGNTAKAIMAVVDGSKAVESLVSEIAIASEEQAVAISQITQGLDQISSVVQTNSATAEESAAASEELSGQASMLKELVGTFKLRENSEAEF